MCALVNTWQLIDSCICHCCYNELTQQQLLLVVGIAQVMGSQVLLQSGHAVQEVCMLV